ncbi:protein kinase domain-containing protein [Paenibacillus sp. 481]|uniref:protein kinase domain-containing protein n=1 Tax=Paenibacillus sp. 481 TaxID=2835869 RepID=UPI001E56E919|nr:serine/threonine protein kinase [Paenibacillus sp. 481]UHA75315.1 serine/threonine protein kinase [Paenibacillus sp. 481]
MQAGKPFNGRVSGRAVGGRAAQPLHHNKEEETSAEGVRLPSLSPGVVVTGVWNRQAYRIERPLGRGANGVVYLVTRLSSGSGYSKEQLALKFGSDAIDFQSEINALTSLEQEREKREEQRHLDAGGAGGAGVAENSTRSFLIDVDDMDTDVGRLPFYIMRYVPGITLKSYVRKRGVDWFGFIGGKLLVQLKELHHNGWVFGDIKAENVLVSEHGEVELVDYGGVTPIGRSVKQFTVWYDRAFWHAGSRIAEPSYDLFSFAVLAIYSLNEAGLKKRAKTQLPQMRSREDLLDIVRKHHVLRGYEVWLTKAIQGTFSSTDEAYRLWQQISHQLYRTPSKAYRPTPIWVKWTLALSIMLLVFCAMFWLWDQG